MDLTWKCSKLGTSSLMPGRMWWKMEWSGAVTNFSTGTTASFPDSSVPDQSYDLERSANQAHESADQVH